MMRLLILTVAVLLTTSPPAVPQSPNIKKPAASTSETRANQKLEREILKMENQLRQALEKCDPAQLERLLADYYSDSYEGSEQAVGKAGTIARCRAGGVPYYSIDKDRKLSVRAEIVVIEGIANDKPDAGTDVSAEDRKQVHVERYWTKKNGRWQLIAQSIAEAE